MKKILFILLVSAVVFISCDFPDFYYFIIKNESSKPVSYTFNESINIETLAPTEHKNYQVNAGKRFTSIGNIDAGNPYGYGFSIRLKHETTKTGSSYTFYDFIPYNLNVVNTLSEIITITAGNYIDNAGLSTLTINANSNITTAKIYTNKPNFISITNYPVIIDWEFAENTVYVIIR